MGRIVCVHGVGQQVSGEQSLLRDWTPALLDGLSRAGHVGAATAADVTMAFYGNLFRPPGDRLTIGDPMFTADDIEPGLENACNANCERDVFLVETSAKLVQAFVVVEQCQPLRVLREWCPDHRGDQAVGPGPGDEGMQVSVVPTAAVEPFIHMRL